MKMLKLTPRLFLVLLVLASPFVLAFRIAAQAAGIEEPWATLIFLVLVPLIVQLVKFIADKQGKEVANYVSQALSFLLALGYVIVSGGFSGLTLPIFPAWDGDAFGFVGAIVTYAGLWVTLIASAMGSVEVAYRLVLKRVMEKSGFATARAVMERKALEG